METVMETSDLIRTLAADTRPVRSGQAPGRLIIALAAGGAAVMTLIAMFLGDPFSGVERLGVMTFGVKLGFSASLLLLSSLLLLRAGQPGHDPRGGLPWIAAPVLVMALIAAISLVQEPAEARTALIFGKTWLACLLSVSLLAIPVFAFLVWAFRRLAPTDLKLAGTLAGAASGSVAALVYGLHCPEGSPAFLLVWYGLGIAIAAIAGRLAGPLLLRW